MSGRIYSGALWESLLMQHTFEQFKRAVTSAGLTPVQCTPVHWQIKGGQFVVNYYPTRGTLFVNRTNKGTVGSVQDAIRAATNVPKIKRYGDRMVRRGVQWRRRTRRLIYRYRPCCHWCAMKFDGPDDPRATIEHIVPLVRGGGESMDNLALACEPCNRAHGGGKFLGA